MSSFQIESFLEQEDLIGVVRDTLQKLNGEPNSLDQRRKAFFRFLDEPTQFNHERLREAYQAVRPIGKSGLLKMLTMETQLLRRFWSGTLTRLTGGGLTSRNNGMNICANGMKEGCDVRAILEKIFMSENFLRFIPIDPAYVPPLALQQQARDTLAAFLPDAAEVVVSTTPLVEWIDPGTNFERVICPICRKELNMQWWQQEMDKSYQTTHFADLMIKVPCCGASLSLNDLQYEWPAGFARFVLEARNPSNDINAHQLHQLEQIVQFPLRKIWAHL